MLRSEEHDAKVHKLFQIKPLNGKKLRNRTEFCANLRQKGIRLREFCYLCVWIGRRRPTEIPQRSGDGNGGRKKLSAVRRRFRRMEILSQRCGEAAGGQKFFLSNAERVSEGCDSFPMMTVGWRRATTAPQRHGRGSGGLRRHSRF